MFVMNQKAGKDQSTCDLNCMVNVVNIPLSLYIIRIIASKDPVSSHRDFSRYASYSEPAIRTPASIILAKTQQPPILGLSRGSSFHRVKPLFEMLPVDPAGRPGTNWLSVK